ncbi:MAG: class II glutamine amidotransferase, partial [Gammaproteobacteria bacterium]|nr:class II glutamine amidotransferase [Gammaproteobacteria bacterium]
MCELLAMSSSVPVTVNLSLRAFAEHGGGTGPHDDGWGIAYYHGAYARIIKDVRQAAGSDWVSFVEGRDLRSTSVIAHIRHGTRGGISLENTHPFARELGGRVHVFAHNGTLRDYERDSRFRLDAYRPIGETDSEWVFCVLLGRLREAWTSGAQAPPLGLRRGIVEEFARDVRELGAANFIYCDSEYLFAHATARTHDDGRVGPPGLNMLERRVDDPT